MQLFGELDYIREANNCDRFRELYGEWNNVEVPAACTVLTRRRVLVMEWVDGEKGPWDGKTGLKMVRVGLRCSVDQLMTTGLFHADPHRGNLLRTPENKLAFIDFGMMADIDEEDRYGLFGLVIGLQTKDLSLVTENLLKVRKRKSSRAHISMVFVRFSLKLAYFLNCHINRAAWFLEGHSTARRACPATTCSPHEFHRRNKEGIGCEFCSTAS